MHSTSALSYLHQIISMISIPQLLSILALFLIHSRLLVLPDLNLAYPDRGIFQVDLIAGRTDTMTKKLPQLDLF